VRDVLQVIVRSVRSLSGARYTAIGIPGDRGSFAEFVVDGISDRQRKAIGPLPRQHGMLAVMLREGQPLRLAGITAAPTAACRPHPHARSPLPWSWRARRGRRRLCPRGQDEGRPGGAARPARGGAAAGRRGRPPRPPGRGGGARGPRPFWGGGGGGGGGGA